MPKSNEHLLHARALRADLLASPEVWVPRRDVLLTWLNAFLARAEAPRYEPGEAEVADLTALDRFLRKQNVPSA